MIEAEKLILRPPVERDVDAWTSILTDPLVARYLGSPIRGRADVERHVRMCAERHAADGFGLLAVERKADRRVIGRSGFLVWDRRRWTPTTLADASEHGDVEIGWTLASDCWGLGYATEAGAACLAHGLDTLGRERIISVIQHANDRSVAVATRLGMEHEQDVRTARGFDVGIWVSTAL